MILKEWSDNEVVASVNTWSGYPSIYGHLERMKLMDDWCENSEHKVIVSGKFWYNKKELSQDKFLCTGAHPFRFWFVNDLDAARFYQLFGGNYEKPPVSLGKGNKK